MKNTRTGIKQDSVPGEAAVVDLLVEHPDYTSREIADTLRISRDELLRCYGVIRASAELQDAVINRSKYPRLTRSTAELVSDYSRYLTSVLSGVTVYPLILEFHPGPVCQCHCKFCFSDGYDYTEIASGQTPVSPERVAALFAECRENGVEEVWFSGGKEPFINPRTPDYIRLANKLGFRTRLYTNGIGLNQSAQEAVLGCYQIRISISGAKSETFHKIQFPKYTAINMDGLFDRTLANIAGLVELKKERSSAIRIGISQILQPDNHDEMLAFAEMGRQLGVDSVHYRLEAMGMVRDFTPAEKGAIRQEIEVLSASHDGLELDIRGVEEGEFDSKESQFLPGIRKPVLCRAGLLKRGLNPYGALYNCEFSSHPRFHCNAARLCLGDATKESIGDILRRRVGKYPEPCDLCQAHEYGLNVTLERLEADLKWGIPVDKQPYFKARENSRIPFGATTDKAIYN